MQKRCQNMETRKKLCPSCKRHSWRRSEKSPTIPTLVLKRRRRKKRQKNLPLNDHTNEIQINTPLDEDPNTPASIPEQTLGVPKSLAWHVMTKVNLIPASLFPLMWNGLGRSWKTPHLPRHHKSISSQESPCVSLSSLEISSQSSSPCPSETSLPLWYINFHYKWLLLIYIFI